MRRALLVYNPTAGRQRHAERLGEILDALREGGIDAQPAPTERPHHATQLARAAAAAGEAEVVIAWGGDGTVREVATGLLGSDVALGVLPGGTVNVVAIALGLPRRAPAAARVLGGLQPRPIDVGLCAGHPFLMQASSGIEARLMAVIAGSRLKTRLGLLGIVIKSLPVALHYAFPDIELRVDGRPARAKGAMVCNISEVAGPYRMIPDGRFDDGRLEMLLFHGRGRSAALGFCVDLFFGVHAHRRDVEILDGIHEVRFEGPAGAPIQVDGDALEASHPCTVGLSPHRLRVLAPALPAAG
jgi:diacylglycerol kinase family enzyme